MCLLLFIFLNRNSITKNVYNLMQFVKGKDFSNLVPDS